MLKHGLLAGAVAAAIILAGNPWPTDTTEQDLNQSEETTSGLALAALGDVDFGATNRSDAIASPVVVASALEPIVRSNAGKRIVAEPVASALPPQIALDATRMSGELASLAQSGSNDWVDVIVRYSDTDDEAQVERLTAMGARVNHSYDALPFRTVSVPASSLAVLAADQDVDFISQDERVFAMAVPAHATAKLPSVGSANDVAVLPGIGVAVIDSGIGMHSDLNVVSRVDFISRYQSCNGSLMDNFDTLSHEGDNGTRRWLTDWIETGDDGLATSGSIRVVPAPKGLSTGALRFTPGDASISRAFDVSDGASVTLAFTYRTSGEYDENEFAIGPGLDDELVLVVLAAGAVGERQRHGSAVGHVEGARNAGSARCETQGARAQAFRRRYHANGA